jgi:diadenosine tetraphosphate (Ap4A) HIT family hydrolase
VRQLTKTEALAAIAADRRDGCRMCALAVEQEPIASSEHAVAVLDRFASRPGHVLVIARRHVERVPELAWDEYAAIQRLAYDLCGAVERALAPRRIYVAALGSADAIDTSFPHHHVHVVPLADGGEPDRPANVFTWVNGVYVFESAAEERDMLERLRRAYGAVE